MPEVFIECQDVSRFGFGEVQERHIARAGKIRAGPEKMVALDAEHLDHRLRKILIGEKAHSGGNGKCPVLVGEVTSIGEAGKDVFPRYARIVSDDLAFRLACGQEFQYELDSEARSANHGFARQNIGVDDDAL